ncbi:MAG: enoyl-CoA hydratase-related protein [Bacteroidota bacterium]
MEFENLHLRTENGILYLTINRPSKLNALNLQTMSEIKAAFRQAEEDTEVKAVIVTGSGEKAFVAGADISEIANLDELHARKFSESGQEVFNQIENLSKPVIAAVNGFALGGGCELAMACHIRLASDNTKFGLPEITLGIIPGYGGTQRLPLYIGKSRALELMLTGKMIEAEQALNWGLVNYVVPQEELIPTAEKLLSKIVKQAPIAATQIIAAANAVFRQEAGYQLEANAFANCCRTEDFREGTTAFLEKRKPQFTGK